MSPRPHFEVFAVWKLLRRQRWYWRLVAANGEIVAVSGEAFSSVDNARRGVEDVQRIVRDGPDVRLAEAR